MSRAVTPGRSGRSRTSRSRRSGCGGTPKHRRSGDARRPGGGPGPPPPRPALHGPTLRGRGHPLGSAAPGSTQRPHGDRRLSPGEGRVCGRPGRAVRPGSSERLGAAVDGALDACGGCRGSTPLHSAARYGSVESAKLLLAAKASVDIKNNKGWGPQPMSPFRFPPATANVLQFSCGMSCDIFRSAKLNGYVIWDFNGFLI
eukprot:s1204_g1.t1